jgi:hypothetical protein
VQVGFETQPGQSDGFGYPPVTAVVPTRDRPELLRRAVRAILDQDYAGHIECIVVFDRVDPVQPDVDVPTNRTLRIVTNTRTPGLAGTRNTGYLQAQGVFVCGCDDDDEWLLGKVSAQVQLLRARPDASACGTGILINHRGQDFVRLAETPQLTFDDFLLDRHMQVNSSSVMARKEGLVGPIGLVDEELPGGYAEDYEWLLRAARTGPIVCVSEALTRIYWHDSSFFVSRWTMIDEALTYLLARVPEFSRQPRGLARIEGQIAFANAALGQRRRAVRYAGRSLRRSRRVRHSYAALLVASGLISAERVISAGRRLGRGI